MFHYGTVGMHLYVTTDPSSFLGGSRTVGSYRYRHLLESHSAATSSVGGGGGWFHIERLGIGKAVMQLDGTND